MNAKGMAALLMALLLTGCAIGTTSSIRLRGNVDPAQISLSKRTPAAIEASVENIGNSTQTVTVDVVDTEGLSIEKPERTTFTLKPGEARVATFTGILEETAVPGNYVIEIVVDTEKGERIKERVTLKVVAEKGLI
ncbi:MAG: hypothetical protein D6733_06610 [Methanobacteriota archaeon]|nr:MAG: hypothetical protein D6733_06610 [Euryarchaeota archaeon]